MSQRIRQEGESREVVKSKAEENTISQRLEIGVFQRQFERNFLHTHL